MHIVIAFAVGLVVGVILGYAFRSKENKAVNAVGGVVKKL